MEVIKHQGGSGEKAGQARPGGLLLHQPIAMPSQEGNKRWCGLQGVEGDGILRSRAQHAPLDGGGFLFI